MVDRPIPQKLYYRIGEVAEIAGVKPHVLRYWESEFGFLSPHKNEGNHRLYTPKDLEKVLAIRKLLYEEKFTIAGAKKRFSEMRGKKAVKPQTADPKRVELISKIKKEVNELKELL